MKILLGVVLILSVLHIVLRASANINILVIKEGKLVGFIVFVISFLFGALSLTNIPIIIVCLVIDIYFYAKNKITSNRRS